MSHAPTPSHTHCQNCGAELRGPFCHQCGQHDFDFHRSFGHVFHEALENFFHFDAKFFRDIVTLLFRPGRLSGDFNAGKRVSQMPPFRLYLFISVLFFFIQLLGAGPKTPLMALDESDAERSAAVRQAVKSAAKDFEVRTPAGSEASERLREAVKKDAAALPPGQLSPKTVHEIAKQVAAEHERTKPDDTLGRYFIEKGTHALEHQEEFSHAVLIAVPKMLLVCLPIFALYTRFLFRKSGQNYLQHLIVSVHYHTFVYLWWLVADGWEDLFGFVTPGLASLATFASGLWLVIYPVVMLHHLYANSWKRTFFKTVLLAGTYALTLAFAFIATAAIVFLVT